MKETLTELIQKLNDSLIESELVKGKVAEARIQGKITAYKQAVRLLAKNGGYTLKSHNKEHSLVSLFYIAE